MVFHLLLIIFLSVLACFKISLQGSMSRRFVHGPQDSIWFNGLLFAAIMICLAVVFPFAMPDLTTVLYAVGAGLGMVVFQSCYAMGLATGPVSLTALIINFSVLLVSGFGIVVFGDNLYLSQFVGVAALVVSFFLSVDWHEKKKSNRRWLVIVILGLLGDTAVCCLQRLYQATASAAVPGRDVTFLLVMYLSGSLLAFLFYGWNSRRSGKSAMGFQRPVLIYVALIAAILSIYQKLTMYAITVIQGTVYYPTHVGLLSLLTTLTGILFFRDRLTTKQKWGLVCGIACVVLMNVQIGPAL